MEDSNEDVLGLTSQIVSAHVSHNTVAPDALPSLIQEVYRTLVNIVHRRKSRHRPFR
jgi:predicted transcriptional regulator